MAKNMTADIKEMKAARIVSQTRNAKRRITKTKSGQSKTDLMQNTSDKIVSK